MEQENIKISQSYTLLQAYRQPVSAEPEVEKTVRKSIRFGLSGSLFASILFAISFVYDLDYLFYASLVLFVSMLASIQKGWADLETEWQRKREMAALAILETYSMEDLMRLARSGAPQRLKVLAVERLNHCYPTWPQYIRTQDPLMVWID